MPSLERIVARLVAEGRVARARRRPGVTIGARTRFGPQVRVRASRGGRVVIGADVTVGGGTQLVADGGELRIGDRVFIAGSCIMAAAAEVAIGEETMLAEMVCVRDHDHDPDAPPRSGRILVSPVQIGARSWLASKASVVRGGQVGADTVIGAHALVNRPIPSGVVAVGVPAKIARQRRV